jgi:hypothetical protein
MLRTGAAGAEQSFHRLGCFLDRTARLAGLKLAPERDERLIGVVQPPRQDGRNVKNRDRADPQGGRIDDVELQGLQRTHVRRVRLIEQHGELAEHSTGLRHRGDLDAIPEDGNRTFRRISSRPVVAAAATTVSPAW